MEETNFKIKAKKISELDNFIDSHSIQTDGSDAWVVLAYTKDNRKENYKINLGNIISLIANNIQLDDIENQIQELRDLIGSQTKSYRISYNLTNVNQDSSNIQYIKEGDSVVLKFTAYTGYSLPNTGMVTGLSTESYRWDLSNSELTLRIENAHITSQSIYVSIQGVPNTFKIFIDYDSNSMSYSYLTTVKQGYTINDSIQIQFTAKPGYSLPNNIDVTNANNVSYDSSSGILSFKCAGTGNMQVSGATGSKNSFSISYSLENVSKSYNSPTTAEYGSNQILIFTENQGYEMPDNVIVTGNCGSYNYDKANKRITITNVLGDINVKITGVAKEFTIGFELVHIDAEISDQKSTYHINNTISIKLTAHSGYKLPSNINLTGCTRNSYTLVGNYEATLVVKCSGTENMIVSATGLETKTYYFGMISAVYHYPPYNKINTDKIDVNYSVYANGNLKDDQFTVSINNLGWLTSAVDECPYKFNEIFNPTLTLEGFRSFIIVPAKYYIEDTETFTDGIHTGHYYSTSMSPMPVTIGAFKCKFKINGDDYYALYVGAGLDPTMQSIIK